MVNERKSRRREAADARKPAAKRASAAASHARGGGLFDLDSEQSARLLILGAVALVVAVAAGFLIFGYWYSVVRPRNRTVLQVADHKVTYAAMKRRMIYEAVQNSTYQSNQGIQLLPSAAFQTVMDELTKITQAGPKLGITVDQSEEDAKLRVKLALPENPDQRQFADALRKALDTSGLSESEYRTISAAELYGTKILDKFQTDAPATMLQAKLGVIASQTEDAAKQAIARVNSGEDFSEVAKAVSTESDASTTGGVKDYATQESTHPTYRDFAFSADIGSISAPLAFEAANAQTQGTTVTYYVVKVLDRSDQPLSDTQKGQVASGQLPDWLKTTQDEMRGNGTLKEDWTQKAQSDALGAIAAEVRAKVEAKQRQQAVDQQRSQDIRSTSIAQLTASPQVAETPTPEGTAATPTSEQGASPEATAPPVATSTNGP